MVKERTQSADALHQFQMKTLMVNILILYGGGRGGKAPSPPSDTIY